MNYESNGLSFCYAVVVDITTVFLRLFSLVYNCSTIHSLTHSLSAYISHPHPLPLFSQFIDHLLNFIVKTNKKKRREKERIEIQFDMASTQNHNNPI